MRTIIHFLLKDAENLLKKPMAWVLKFQNVFKKQKSQKNYFGEKNVQRKIT